MIGSKIRELRKAKRMTLEELAAAIGTSKQTIHRYENGIIIRRNSPDYEEQYDKTFYQLSYLAKVRGKENRDKGSWLIKTSR